MQNGDINIQFISTEDQLADVFTKPLNETRFNKLISELDVEFRKLIKYYSVYSNLENAGKELRVQPSKLSNQALSFLNCT